MKTVRQIQTWSNVTSVSKNNPVDIDIYTFESVKHSGLYAMGPLVGDNFVRFLQGRALATSTSEDHAAYILYFEPSRLKIRHMLHP